MNSHLILLRVLIVCDNSDFRYLIREMLKKRFSLVVTEAVSLQEASDKMRARNLDVVVWGHNNYEVGAQLYRDVSDEREAPLKFVMFMHDPSLLPEKFYGTFPAVRNPDFKGLVEAVDRLQAQSNLVK